MVMERELWNKSYLEFMKIHVALGKENTSQKTEGNGDYSKDFCNYSKLASSAVVSRQKSQKHHETKQDAEPDELEVICISNVLGCIECQK